MDEWERWREGWMRGRGGEGVDERERWREGWMRGRSGVGRGRRVGCTVSRTWVGTMGVGCGVLRDMCNCAQPIHSNLHTMLSF